jgi:hypothetical protein
MIICQTDPSPARLRGRAEVDQGPPGLAPPGDVRDTARAPACQPDRGQSLVHPDTATLTALAAVPLLTLATTAATVTAARRAVRTAPAPS